jgi:hypothetical protein
VEDRQQSDLAALVCEYAVIRIITLEDQPFFHGAARHLQCFTHSHTHNTRAHIIKHACADPGHVLLLLWCCCCCTAAVLLLLLLLLLLLPLLQGRHP